MFSEHVQVAHLRDGGFGGSGTLWGSPLGLAVPSSDDLLDLRASETREIQSAGSELPEERGQSRLVPLARDPVERQVELLLGVSSRSTHATGSASIPSASAAFTRWWPPTMGRSACSPRRVPRRRSPTAT